MGVRVGKDLLLCHFLIAQGKAEGYYDFFLWWILSKFKKYLELEKRQREGERERERERVGERERESVCMCVCVWVCLCIGYLEGYSICILGDYQHN